MPILCGGVEVCWNIFEGKNGSARLHPIGLGAFEDGSFASRTYCQPRLGGPDS